METQYLILILLLVVISLAAITFYKVRKIHLATFRLEDKVNDVYFESKHVYAQVQAYLDLVRLLKIEGSLPILRGWAASPDFLLEVAKDALAVKPKVVVECSSGASTVVLARCLELNGAGQVVSLEHDPAYAEKTRRDLARLGLGKWATVIDAPLKETPGLPGHRWYDADKLGDLGSAVDMLVVDGPPQTTCSLARYPAIPVLKERLAAQCRIYIDDAARPDEREMVRRWMAETSMLLQEELHCEKGGVRLIWN